MTSTRSLSVSARQALSAVGRQRASLLQTGHRPFPLPRAPWVMGQSWIDLLFAHWAVPEATIRPLIPPELAIDTFDGSAWLGITPFEVVGLHPRAVPPLPWLSRFPELNVRTYVTAGGRPGIWFLSLDAARASAVAAARLGYRLPYRLARMKITRRQGRVLYHSRAVHAPAELSAAYEPVGRPLAPAPGTLEHFLTERYRLYTVGRRQELLSADIHHRPWPLQPADGAISVNTMTAPVGIDLPDDAPLLHYAGRQDVLIWPPARAFEGSWR